MAILPHKQLSLAEIYSDCTNSFENNKHHFLTLLEENANLVKLIPRSSPNLSNKLNRFSVGK